MSYLTITCHYDHGRYLTITSPMVTKLYLASTVTNSFYLNTSYLLD